MPWGYADSDRAILKHHVGQPCPYCGTTMASRGTHKHSPTRDHIVPKCKGTDLTSFGMWNRLVVCRWCNEAKADLTLMEFYLVLADRSDPRALHVLRVVNRIGELAPTLVRNKLLGIVQRSALEVAHAQG